MAEHPKKYPTPGVRMTGFLQALVGTTRRPLLLLLGLVALLLLIAWANLASLFLARAAQRQRELAVRLALGASRWRILRERLAESLVVAFAGAVVIVDPGDLPTLAGALAVVIASPLLAAWLPARRAARLDPLEALRQD